MDPLDERDLELDELEVLCPLNDHEATIQVRTDDNPFENATVVYCPNFGDEPITCGQPCLQYEKPGS